MAMFTSPGVRTKTSRLITVGSWPTTPRLWRKSRFSIQLPAAVNRRSGWRVRHRPLIPAAIPIGSRATAIGTAFPNGAKVFSAQDKQANNRKNVEHQNGKDDVNQQQTKKTQNTQDAGPY